MSDIACSTVCNGVLVCHLKIPHILASFALKGDGLRGLPSLYYVSSCTPSFCVSYHESRLCMLVPLLWTAIGLVGILNFVHFTGKGTPKNLNPILFLVTIFFFGLACELTKRSK